MTDKTVAQKAHVKPGTTIALINGVAGVVESLGLPKGVSFVNPGEAQLVFLFAQTRSELEKGMPAAVGRLSADSIDLGVQKGAKQAGLDMNRNTVWALAEKLGLRPLGLVAVDEKWSVFRLRPGGPADVRTRAEVRGRRTRG
jgi:hypothetical protein